MNRFIGSLFFCLLAVQAVVADVRLPKVFGSHMVLQRRKPVLTIPWKRVVPINCWRKVRKIPSRGPMFDKMTVDGNHAVLTFRNVGSGLMVKDKYDYLKGFEVAGVDKKFYYAKADIQGNSIVVHADSVTTPVAVRYGWADDNGDVNVYNKEGFPAVPFRTDTWPGITEAVRFGEK